MTTARDFYREATKSAGVGMHQNLIRRYAERQALLLAPIAPHWAEYIWLEVLEKQETVHSAQFPNAAPVNPQMAAIQKYIRSTMSSVTSAEGAQNKRLAKGKGALFDPKKDYKLTIFYADSLPAWQDGCVKMVRGMLEDLGVVDIKTISKKMDKAAAKQAMPFVQHLKKQLDAGLSREEVLGTELLFDELAVLREMVPGLLQTLSRCKVVEMVRVSGDDERRTGTLIDSGVVLPELPLAAAGAAPGNPGFSFGNLAN